MTTPNPFAQAPTAQPAQQPQAAAPNPFGAVPTAPAPAQATASAPAFPAQGNPFPPQAPAPAQPSPFPAPGQQVAGQATYGVPQQVPAQQWQQPPAAAPAAPPAFDMNRFGAAGAPPATGGKGPDLAAMYSRLVIMFPLREETVPRNPQFVTAEQRAAGNVNQQRLTATLVVLDSGPGTQPGGSIAWGGNPQVLGGQPHPNNDPLPYVRKSMWINQTKIIEQARPFMPATPGGAPGMLVGRPVKTGPEHNAPWYLTTATDQEMELARTYITLVTQGQYPHPLAP